MKVGNTEFAGHIKGWSFHKFKEVYENNVAVKGDLARYGLTLEKAWEKITGKKNVPKVYKKAAKDKD